MPDAARPNYRLSWQTCPWCQTEFRGHAETPCPRCAAFPGREPAWYERPWLLFWIVVASAGCTVAAVMLLAAKVAH